MKRPTLQSKRVGVSRMAFRGSKVFGSFEKRTPGVKLVSITNRNYDGDKNVKNLNIQQLKTGLLHNLHVRFSCL